VISRVHDRVQHIEAALSQATSKLETTANLVDLPSLLGRMASNDRALTNAVATASGRLEAAQADLRERTNFASLRGALDAAAKVDEAPAPNAPGARQSLRSLRAKGRTDTEKTAASVDRGVTPLKRGSAQRPASVRATQETPTTLSQWDSAQALGSAAAAVAYDRYPRSEPSFFAAPATQPDRETSAVDEARAGQSRLRARKAGAKMKESSLTRAYFPYPAWVDAVLKSIEDPGSLRPPFTYKNILELEGTTQNLVTSASLAHCWANCLNGSQTPQDFSKALSPAGLKVVEAIECIYLNSEAGKSVLEDYMVTFEQDLQKSSGGQTEQMVQRLAYGRGGIYTLIAFAARKI
jgi:hypothetical protein